MTLKEAQAKYEATRRTTRSFRQAAKLLDRVVNFLGPTRRPKDVFRADVKSFIIWSKENGRGQVHETLTTARAFWNFMASQELVEFNPFHGCETLYKQLQ
jgi:site-specific recombinase XerD